VLQFLKAALYGQLHPVQFRFDDVDFAAKLCSHSADFRPHTADLGSQVAAHRSKLATQLSRAGVDLRIERGKQNPVFPKLGRYDVLQSLAKRLDHVAHCSFFSYIRSSFRKSLEQNVFA
jgi:hypothetical protein